MNEDFDKYLVIANHDIQKAINMEELKKYVASILYEMDNLEDRLRQKENIIKEVREYITSFESIETIQQCEHSENNKGLDRDTMVEMTNRHLKVHDKILGILEKENTCTNCGQENE